jgi:putative aldouronate transport system permease protein
VIASRNDKIVYSINTTILLLLALLCLYPLLYIIASSLSSGSALNARKVFLWPIGFNTVSYTVLIKNAGLANYFKNSIIFTVIGTMFCLVCTILCAYPLSRPHLIGRNKISFFVMFTMIFGGGMIPNYLLIRSLGLIDTYWAIWLASLISPYNMMIMRNFFQNVPIEISEAAEADGCNEFRMLLQIYLPLSTAVIATLALFYGVGYWNSYQSIMIYINDSKKYTLPVFIQQIVFELNMLDVDTNVDVQQTVGESDIISEGVKSAGVVVLLVPMLIIYPFLQKYFVKGVIIGAVKG